MVCDGANVCFGDGMKLFGWGKMVNDGIAPCKGGCRRNFAGSSPVRDACVRVGLEKQEAMGAAQRWWDTARGVEPH